jgi:hypothetical protein
VRRALLACAGAVIVVLTAPAVALAFYGNGARLISADYVRQEQGDDATVFAAISADGRYVAMQTRARNFFPDNDPDPPGRYRAGGIFRFDLATDGLEKVADGDLFDEDTNEFLRRGASNPSISADGRFVAFATAQQLVARDTNDNVDVYVRDMRVAADRPRAFDLVSARDGGDAPASYGPPQIPLPGSNPGADVSRGVAISGDGERVAFRTDAPSDLPAAASADVPAGQVFVRDRVQDRTLLMTRTQMTNVPAGGALGAALSADGSTVAWTGSNAPAQTRFLGGENEDPSFLYYLWRRVSGASTRRITGLSDPDDPACPPGSTTIFDQTSTGPCYGPLTDQEGNRSAIGSQVPALSGDGNTVAFLTGAGLRPLLSPGPGLDLFVTEMTPGLSRKQATTELTRDTTNNDPASSPPIGSVAMSASGRYLAITTARTTFALPALQLIGAPRTVPGVRELYVVDLQQRTLDRVARAHDGGDIDADVQNGVTLSADGERVAFSSFAGNLFFGDANLRPDAFVATREPDPGTGPPPPVPGAGGPAGTIESDPRISARGRSKDTGVIELRVTVPAAGDVKAVATARAGEPPKRRNLATDRGRALEPGVVELVLRPVQRYRGELRERERIRARAHVSFVAAIGGSRLNTSIGVTFRQRK